MARPKRPYIPVRFNLVLSKEAHEILKRIVKKYKFKNRTQAINDIILSHKRDT